MLNIFLILEYKKPLAPQITAFRENPNSFKREMFQVGRKQRVEDRL